MTPAQFRTLIEEKISQEQDEHIMTVLLKVQSYLQSARPRQMERILTHLNAEAIDYRTRAAHLRHYAPVIMTADIFIAYASAYEDLVEIIHNHPDKLYTVHITEQVTRAYTIPARSEEQAHTIARNPLAELSAVKFSVRDSIVESKIVEVKTVKVEAGSEPEACEDCLMDVDECICVNKE